jgi:hypothetical protein
MGKASLRFPFSSINVAHWLRSKEQLEASPLLGALTLWPRAGNSRHLRKSSIPKQYAHASVPQELVLWTTILDKGRVAGSLT